MIYPLTMKYKADRWYRNSVGKITENIENSSFFSLI